MSNLNSEKTGIQSLKIKWLTGTLLFFFIYATLRYIVFKGVDPVHFPVYIVNKIFSIAGIIFIALSYTISKVNWFKFNDDENKVQFIQFAGLVGFSFSAMHVFLSLLVISPEYYPKFYHGNMMNLTGELSMLMGVFSIFCFSIPAITTIPFMQEAVGIKKWQRRQNMGYFGLLTALVHTTVMGFASWLTVAKWPGYLPPISLIGAIIAFVPLYLKLTKKNSGRSN